MKIRVEIIQETPLALCVVPDGDRERAAWLRRNEVTVGDRGEDGLVEIEASERLAVMRGLLTIDAVRDQKRGATELPRLGNCPHDGFDAATDGEGASRAARTPGVNLRAEG